MVVKDFKLKNRDLYLNRLISFKDTEMIKVITGIRRCGKSSLLKLMAEYLRKTGIKDTQIIALNFESMIFYDMDNKQFYSYVKERVLKNEKMYLFFDEVQMIPAWQTAVNSFRVDFDCDIYITGSNAFLLSSELSTYLSGRYVEIKMLPLSFREFIDFNGFELQDYAALTGETLRRVIDINGEMYEIKELFDAYLKYGGMPSVTDAGMQQDKVTATLDGLYSAVVIRDILERGRRKEQRAITDPILLRKLIMFLADNIGNNTSATSIGNILVNEGLLNEGFRKVKPATQTIQAYIEALTESYIFYEIKRFDIKGKEYLRTLGKYYIVDIGLRNYLLGFREGDRGHILENIIYFELLRRGYNVAIGKLGNKEVDFVVTSTDEKKYIQVTESMNSNETRKRELAPLLSIQDNYEKIVLALDCDFTQTIDGIKIIKILDFLLEDF
ncbi:ATP-binding protein [Sedimentibacter hydroxybenzoicus DSM 7310]|uniref:ATP-binding protein n=1 Tax=Sedimentibacter hydroxybenzoicus DSM 7310 TaxID=1123245 RepID=A0A974BGJ0_SEDHY|nr:ATP-binding protein [Sedimentibacter hydroxybenzoicus]NYB72672.1 ATP-binding protein [Sedimentibacter hydroxybenzoicus DSM 7310]